MGKIYEWKNGAVYWNKTFNPWIGCVPCSPACENCYARTLTERFKGSFEPHRTTKATPPHKGLVFCGNATDLFGEFLDKKQIHEWYSNLVTAAARSKYPVKYLVLTKRARRMNELRKEFDIRDEEDIYWGITSENQKMYDERMASFAGAFRNSWLSCEPLLGPIDLRLDHYKKRNWLPSWVVIGCESGSNRRPCDIGWIYDIVVQCQENGVPYFIKQLDIGGKCEKDICKFPKELQTRQMPFDPAPLGL